MIGLMQTTIDAIGDDVYRIHTPFREAPSGFSFNQYLLVDDEPLLFHYVLQSAEGEEAARRRFGDEARRFFVEISGKRAQVEGLGDRLLIHYQRRLKPDRFLELAEDAMKVRRLFR
jgi:hypothetical protein